MYYIYKITNKINNKNYIGLTNNIERRKNRHFIDLKMNKHDNHFLQYEFNKYGIDNFNFEIIFQGDVTSKEISDKEKYFIKIYDSYQNGYNQNEGGNFGPSNGGSHLTKNDVLNILATLEFMSRPGEVLSQIFSVTKTTISRIKQGINHCAYKEYYDSLSYEERKEIFDNFCKTENILVRKANTSKLKTKRQLSKEQVFMIYINEEKNRPISIAELVRKLPINSSNTIYGILRHETYIDYYLEYQKLTESEKEKIVTLLCK